MEEGAEEFFLKPVRLADVNKLKPHMMKTKSKNQEDIPEKQEQQELGSESMESTETTSSPETTSSSSSPLEKSDIEETQPDQEEKEEEDKETQPNSNNKRKPVEEGLSPERTRPRFNGLTVMSN